jgi:hypothetical protein
MKAGCARASLAMSWNTTSGLAKQLVCSFPFTIYGDENKKHKKYKLHVDTWE